jgi:hypothetical protein
MVRVFEEEEVLLAELFDLFLSRNSVCALFGTTTAVFAFRDFPIPSHANLYHHPPERREEESINKAGVQEIYL